VANVCDPNYTFVVKAAKRYLPAAETYRSTHAGLSEVAAEYMRLGGTGRGTGR
jgi:hypothetical protein